MIPPADVKVYDFPTSTFWIDDEGIVYSVPHIGAPPMSKEDTIEYIRRYREMVNNEKRCIIIQTDGSSELPNKEDREWVAQELEAVTKAMAVIYRSPLGRMVANMFFGLKPSSYPVKFFSNEHLAKEWIRQYL